MTTKQLYITMPQPGETITEGTIVKWIAKAGDVVAEGTPLAELETEKALFEYESPFAGKILKILQSEQSRVPVATPIALIDVDSNKAKQYLMLGIAEEADASSGIKEASLQQGRQQDSAHPASTKKSAEVSLPTGKSDLKLSPYVRKLANEHQISHESLVGLAKQNLENRVTKEAIEALIEGGPRKTAAPTTQNSAQKDYDILPFSPIRLRIAENMVKSKQTIPHAHTGLTVDLTNLLKFREAHKGDFQKTQGVSLSLLTLMLPSLIQAIRAYPAVNASYVGEAKTAEIRIFRKIHLGVAVGTDAGLMTPVIKNADALSPVEFAKKMQDVVDRANRKKLLPDDFSGTTFLFNNFGYFGLNSGVQVIQYPLAATLGMGCLEKKVVPIGDGFAVRDTANFFLAFDHRVIDGLEAGKFLTTLKNSLEEFSFKL